MSKLNLAFLPMWDAGHVVSMLELARRLLEADTTGTITATVLLIKPPSASFSAAATAAISSLSSSTLPISFLHLPPPPSFPSSDEPFDFISLFLLSNNPAIKSALLSSPPNALFVDMFLTTALDAAAELGVPSYLYFTASALMLCLSLRIPLFDELVEGDFESYEPGFDLAGAAPAPLPAESLPEPVLRRGKEYEWFVYQGRRFREMRGFLVNTFEEMEVAPLRALAAGVVLGDHWTPPVYPIGPVLCVGDAGGGRDGRRHECVKWLDEQPAASVVFLCFGSLGFFDAEQLKEIAAGLEKSGHRFLWVVRGPPIGDSRTLTDVNLDEVLPAGFIEKTTHRGLVWPSWAPQPEILSHWAVGGFVTHCGWNSCLESLWYGVPMLAWPLYAEQHGNALEMVRDLGLAVGLKMDRKRGNYVEAVEVERGVRCLMGGSEEGKRVREKVGEMKEASRRAVEEGGSSYVNLRKFIHEELI